MERRVKTESVFKDLDWSLLTKVHQVLREMKLSMCILSL